MARGGSIHLEKSYSSSPEEGVAPWQLVPRRGRPATVPLEKT
jgi:hypothetical protein